MINVFTLTLAVLVGLVVIGVSLYFAIAHYRR